VQNKSQTSTIHPCMHQYQKKFNILQVKVLNFNPPKKPPTISLKV
jgi:hypothetical protein